MMVKCPCCGQSVADEKGPVQMGDDGLPVAIAAVEGLGLPVARSESLKFHVLLDGRRVDRCVGFDRRDGRLWRYQQDAAGSLIIRNDAIQIEQVRGKVTLEELGG